MQTRVWPLVYRNTAVQWGGVLLSAFLQMGILWFLTRALSPVSFGVYSGLLIFYYVGTAFVDFGGNTIAAREIAQNPSLRQRILGEVIQWKVLFAFLFAVATFFIVQSWWKNLDVMTLLWLIAAILVLPCNTLSVVLQVDQRFPSLTLLKVAGGILAFSLVAILFLLEKLTVMAALGAFCAGILLSTGLLFFMTGKKNFPSFVGKKIGLIRRILPQGIAALAGVLYFYQDTLMLKHLVGDGEAGLYNASYRLFGFIATLPGLAMLSLFPILSSVEAENRERFGALYRQAFYRFMCLALPFAFVMASLAGPIVAFLYPASYEATTSVLIILSFGGVALFCGALCSYALIALKGERSWMIFCLIGVVFNFFMNLLLIRGFHGGAQGAAIGTLFTEGLMAFLAMFAVRRKGGVWPFHPHLLFAGLFGLLMGAVAFSLRGLSLPLLLGLLCIPGAGGLALLWSWKGRREG